MAEFAEESTIVTSRVVEYQEKEVSTSNSAHLCVRHLLANC